jgi:putative membrane protein
MKILENLLACAAAAILVAAGTIFSGFARQNPKLSDPEIASVAVVANKIDIGYAEIAKEKSKDPDILQFAKTMASDHKAVIDQAVALVKKLGVTPKDNAMSQKLLEAAEKTKKTLKLKSGNAFNKAYIDNEVAYHTAVIKTVEGTLIPQAANKELKDLLQNVVPTLKAHLEHAEMVQKKFLGK